MSAILNKMRTHSAARRARKLGYHYTYPTT
jgi:hypothetical protein